MRTYEDAVKEYSDISEHLPTLKRLASKCSHITEFGVRTGNSTLALLAGLPRGGTLVSYDINDCSDAVDNHEGKWKFKQADTSKLFLIDKTDMLFIDTLHDYAQVVDELQHALAVRKYIVFHDIVLFGCNDESTGKGPGIMMAILEFLRDNKSWVVQEVYPNNNGLLVLVKQ